EPVRPRTLLEFSDAFACAGFRYDAFAQCYGLSELTLAATSKQIGESVVIRRADRAAIAAARIETQQDGRRSVDAVS
ncbi:AMP-binding protein, partial [Burkholderia pseudomallei]